MIYIYIYIYICRKVKKPESGGLGTAEDSRRGVQGQRPGECQGAKASENQSIF